ncbi:MAG TPA: hypothetical protein VGJ87_25855 [Roseiflexaceae bacterium]
MRRSADYDRRGFQGTGATGDDCPGHPEAGRAPPGYGVKDEQYATVGAALLWTLGQGMGELFTPDVAEV